jgi:hypothetical protein
MARLVRVEKWCAKCHARRAHKMEPVTRAIICCYCGETRQASNTADHEKELKRLAGKDVTVVVDKDQHLQIRRRRR